MKTAISIPDPIFHAAEAFAKSHGLSRSELFAKAVSHYLELNQAQHITEQLNALYTEEPSALDPVVQQLQFASLPQEEW